MKCEIIPVQIVVRYAMKRALHDLVDISSGFEDVVYVSVSRTGTVPVQDFKPVLRSFDTKLHMVAHIITKML